MSSQQIVYNKVPLVLFSGGVDSTYLLNTLLDISDVDVLYVKGPQGIDKVNCELEAREKIFKYFEKYKQFKIRNKFEIDLSAVPCASDFKNAQPLLWLFGAMTVCNGNIHCNVNIAYLMSDDICCKLDTIVKAWNNLCNVTKHEFINIKFPCQYLRKHNVLESIPAKLFKLTWSCESPIQIRNGKYKPCGECIPCITLATEQYRLMKMRSIKKEK